MMSEWRFAVYRNKACYEVKTLRYLCSLIARGFIGPTDELFVRQDGRWYAAQNLPYLKEHLNSAQLNTPLIPHTTPLPLPKLPPSALPPAPSMVKASPIAKLDTILQSDLRDVIHSFDRGRSSAVANQAQPKASLSASSSTSHPVSASSESKSPSASSGRWNIWRPAPEPVVEASPKPEEVIRYTMSSHTTRDGRRVAREEDCRVKFTPFFQEETSETAENKADRLQAKLKSQCKFETLSRRTVLLAILLVLLTKFAALYFTTDFYRESEPVLLAQLESHILEQR